MPNLDGGHYFLTAILPIDNRGIYEHAGVRSSPVNLVRDALATLPTALQSPASEAIGVQSPFARSLRTHFVRLFVLEAPHFNGRDPANSIGSAIMSTDLLQPQPGDRLACPYLVFVADFDPLGDGAGEPRAYLEELWGLAPAELTSVFRYCYGFDADGDATAFANFVVRGQVETTMPFNDYWTIPPPLPSTSPWLFAVPPALALIVGGWTIFGAAWPLWAAIPITLILLGLSLWLDYAWVMALGARPFPAAPNSSLRDVLKALYLQQAFTRFALAQQGRPPAELRAAFSDFVARHRPGDPAGPTQAPGVVGTIFPEAADA